MMRKVQGKIVYDETAAAVVSQASTGAKVNHISKYTSKCYDS
jgi:hypothetical protein